MGVKLFRTQELLSDTFTTDFFGGTESVNKVVKLFTYSTKKKAVWLRKLTFKCVQNLKQSHAQLIFEGSRMTTAAETLR